MGRGSLLERVGREDLTVLLRAERPPGHHGDRALDEADRAVAKGDVDSAGMQALGRDGGIARATLGVAIAAVGLGLALRVGTGLPGSRMSCAKSLGWWAQRVGRQLAIVPGSVWGTAVPEIWLKTAFGSVKRMAAVAR